MMIKTKEKMLPVEEHEKKKEEEEEEETEEETEDEATEDEEEEEEEEKQEEGQEICNDDEEESTVGGEKEVKVVPQATGENIPSPVLILNNEVVKMRKEVKRIRVLIIRKLFRQAAVLKKNKGKEAEIEKNQRRAARLMEEVQCMKKLKPDLVTKTALQITLNFEQVCKNPKSTLSDRAIARIATHPQFNKKIESIKAAVQAFKDDRVIGKLGGKTKVQKQPEKASLPSPKKKVEREKKKNKKDRSVGLQKITDNEKVGVVLKDNEAATAANFQREMEKDKLVDVHIENMSKSTNARPVSVQNRDAKVLVKVKPQSRALSVPAAPKKSADDDESDVESSDNEQREYFDDSTEERFHKQSSQSEDSEDDDFFIGKVSKFKKKKKQKDNEGEKSPDQEGNVKKDPTGSEETSDKLQIELDKLEARLKSKTPQSIFCSSLGGSKSGGGISRGRGSGKFRGQGKFKRDVGHEKGTSESKYSQACAESARPDRVDRGFASGGRGRGRGRGGVRGQKDHRGGGVFSRQAPQPALHPSWEASKKRKEQQGQILAFQGKKIKFDDDD
ncbi:serum response factor-binding protein 1 [Cololabis saira]|uniref:serum response factor-binding protein 1 n=1 Tax=Cololabis saira TaxID=129043 RepID=UPI002AD24ECE|nr:serum response factor-binding protein 1 [Cololabis saira]